MAVATLNVSAQTINTFGDLRAKVLHVGQKLTGQNTANDQAIAVIVRELAMNYQGRLSYQQFQELKDTIEGMRRHISEDKWQTVLNSAVRKLKEKTDTLDIQQHILDYYKRVPQEQIYVHTDKPYYVPGDTVWFRAHLVDAVTHTPISRSRYVYVELHDQQADTLVQRIIVKCDSDGVFANAIMLPNHLHSGCYTLAAYTQWMRNFPVECFFYKQLMVTGSSSEGNHRFLPREPMVPAKENTSFCQENNQILTVQRKGQLLIQFNGTTDKPLACTLYGSGNLIVADYTQSKVLRIDCQSLRPGNINVAMVNRETGGIVAESQTSIEAQKPQVTINSKAQSNNDLMELNIDFADADGTPLFGNFSLSVTDYDVVKPDTLQPAIDEYLSQQTADYSLANMLSGTYPRIDYGFQTSQTISGSIRSTLFKKVKRPKLMLVRPDTGFRTTFELGDSSRFAINGLDFPDGTTYVLEGMRQTGSTRLVQLNIDPQTFPVLLSMLTTQRSSFTIPESFAKQAKEQVMYGSVDREIELPEVVKEKKRLHKPTNLMGILPLRAYYDDDPMLNNFASMEILLSTLGFSVYFEDTEWHIQSRTGSGTVSAHHSPTVFIDEFRSNVEELMLLHPAAIESIEYFDPVGATSMTIYGWDVPVGGLLLVRQKPGHRFRTFRPLSMVTVRHQGWKPDVEFYSPQYTDKSQKTRPDHRTTLYWNPKMVTDKNGHAIVRFYASDISKRYLVTIEGVSNDGTVVHHQQVIE
jgi:hypothetical protein